MSELRQALAEISAIRTQVARDTQFRGYGPRSIAASGALAFVVASWQTVLMGGTERAVPGYLAVWVTTAAISVALSSWEMVARSRRVHSGFAREMIHAAVEQFMPSVVIGILLTAVLVSAAPRQLWMLPGLWQLLFSLGIFASCRFLPRPMFAVGLWYLTSGLVCLMLASATGSLSPWYMGVPFGIGQVLVAAVLRYGSEDYVEVR
jgi:hypothetical protein